MAFSKFKGKKFTQITGSGNTVRKETYRKIPAVLKSGKKARFSGDIIANNPTSADPVTVVNNTSGFFDVQLILSASDKSINSPIYDDNAIHVEQDLETGEIGVYITASVFLQMMDGYFTGSLAASSYADISQSFNGQIGTGIRNMSGPEAYVGILASQFELGSTGSAGSTDVLPPPTCSIKAIETPGIAYNDDGSPRVRKVTYFNSSSNFTNSHFELTWHNNSHGKLGYDEKQSDQTDVLVAIGRSNLTRSFGQIPAGNSADRFYYVQSKPIKEFSFLMSSSITAGASTSSFFTLTSSFSGAADFGLFSGSVAGRVPETGSTRPKFYNDVDKEDGGYLFVVQKGYVEGDGENGTGEANGINNDANLAFTPNQLIVWYDSTYNHTNIRSASFYFTPYPNNMNQLNTGATTKALITGSIIGNTPQGELRQLYWLNHTYTGSFTSSFGHFTRTELRERTGEANKAQLPYMKSDRGQLFSKKATGLHSSHLWKDKFLSQPAEEGYYVHSSSFSQASQNQMSGSLPVVNSFAASNHTSSYFVLGAFQHPFVTFTDGAIMNYSASQNGEEGVDGTTFMTHHTIASCMFLKRHDNEVFQFQASASGFINSESIG